MYCRISLLPEEMMLADKDKNVGEVFSRSQRVHPVLLRKRRWNITRVTTVIVDGQLSAVLLSSSTTTLYLLL